MDPMELSARAANEGADYLTVPEIARRLRCAPTTIYAAIDAGEFAGVIRIGSKRGYRVPVASYEDYVSRILVPAKSLAA